LKAATYDQNAVMQAALLRRLATLLSGIAPKSGMWVDLGCGTGLFGREGTFTPQRIIGLDIAFHPLTIMRKAPRSAAVLGDIEAAPFRPDSFDGAVVASVLQWVEEPFETLRKISSLLKRGGLLAFSVFTGDSFFELFETLAAFSIRPPVRCPPPDQLTKAISEAGLTLIHGEAVRKTFHYPSARAALKSLSAVGAAARQGRWLTRGELERLCGEYERNYRSAKGIPLTYASMVGVCRKGNTDE
jgi:malonyl-CoA O-methyltransferase